MALKHHARALAIGIVVLLAVLVALCAWYVSDYHHAVDVDSALASSDAVQVQPVQQGWLFDGPGKQDALVFYPGAKVEASAYAPLMNDLAQRGIDCFLVEMPFNLAFLDMNAASSILDVPAYGSYERWFLAGHSLGGAMAANYAADHPKQLSGLVLLAAYPTKSLQTAGFPVLSIYGSNDGVVNRSRIEEGRSLMPPIYEELVIEGGNHAQFGSYGAQDGDSEALISSGEQRAQTADAIADLVARESVPPSTGSITLYGEEHAVPAILDRELELWEQAYADGTRHLFVELPFYTAEFLNLWMASEDDSLLEQLYADWEGTAIHAPQTLEFYRAIKERCPQTVFHGTDVGHQRSTTGTRYLAYLASQGLQDSPVYAQARQCIAQGEAYYASGNDDYRENALVANFIQAFDELDGADAVGIYGSAHTGTEAMSWPLGGVGSMANQLSQRYGEALTSSDLSQEAKASVQPERTETLEVNGVSYQADYFGASDLTSFSADYRERAFWRLADANAYGAFKDLPATGDVLPYGNYPMAVEQGQVFVIDYTRTDGTTERHVYRADGTTWQGQPTTVEVRLP